MSDALGVSTVSISENLFDSANSSAVYTFVVHDATSSVYVATATIPGPQGPPGVQNVYTGPTPPDNPEIGWIWIETP